MTSIKRLFIPTLVVILSSFIGIAAIELVLRTLNLNYPWERSKEANILRNVQFSYDISQLYVSDIPSVDYVRNEYGLRDTCVSPAEIEILTIGGSTTDQRYVSLNSTYQKIIEERMKKSSDVFGLSLIHISEPTRPY